MFSLTNIRRAHVVRWSAFAAALIVALAGCGTASDNGGNGRTEPATPVDLISAPAQLAWENWRGLRLPKSAVDGPKYIGGVAHHGYSRTPQGAVLAAIRGEANLALADDSEWGDVVAVVTAPGPGRTEFSTYRAALSVNGSIPDGQASKFVAFKITAYRAESPTTAAVQIVSDNPVGPPRTAYPVALQWISGDWRIVLPTEAENVDAVEMSSLDGFTVLEQR